MVARGQAEALICGPVSGVSSASTVSEAIGLDVPKLCLMEVLEGQPEAPVCPPLCRPRGVLLGICVRTRNHVAGEMRFEVTSQFWKVLQSLECTGLPFSPAGLMLRLKIRDQDTDTRGRPRVDTGRGRPSTCQGELFSAGSRKGGAASGP